MGAEFTPIFLFIIVAILTAVGMLVASAVLGPRRLTAVKQMPYESGMDPIGDARQRFDVRYYLVAIVFLLFDVELLYLYPWAVAQWSADAPAIGGAPAERTGPVARPATTPRSPALADRAPQDREIPRPGIGIPPGAMRTLVFFDILVFIAILAAAYAYAWRKGVFAWR